MTVATTVWSLFKAEQLTWSQDPTFPFLSSLVFALLYQMHSQHCVSTVRTSYKIITKLEHYIPTYSTLPKTVLPHAHGFYAMNATKNIWKEMPLYLIITHGFLVIVNIYKICIELGIMKHINT